MGKSFLYVAKIYNTSRMKDTKSDESVMLCEVDMHL